MAPILFLLLWSFSGFLPAANGSQARRSGPKTFASAFSPGVQASEQAETWIREIDRFIDEGKLKQARARLKQESAVHGENYETLFREARILFREQNYSESLKVLARCMQLNRGYPELYKLVASDAILGSVRSSVTALVPRGSKKGARSMFA
jgi:tetratricopeptide (TPR) repeat protein